MPTCGDPGRPPCRCRGRATRGRRSSEPDRGATNGRQRRRNACRKTRSRKQGRWREFVQPSTLILSHRPTDCRHHRDRSIDLLLGRLRRGIAVPASIEVPHPRCRGPEPRSLASIAGPNGVPRRGQKSRRGVQPLSSLLAKASGLLAPELTGADDHGLLQQPAMARPAEACPPEP